MRFLPIHIYYNKKGKVFTFSDKNDYTIKKKIIIGTLPSFDLEKEIESTMVKDWNFDETGWVSKQ